MNIDLRELVRDSLLKQGCDESLVSNFDGHSTISLDFSTIPSILISMVEEDVMFWTRLEEHNPHILEQCSASLMTLLLEPVTFSVTGQLQLAEDQGYIILKTVVRRSLLNPADFSEALEEFYLAIKKFMEILR